MAPPPPVADAPPAPLKVDSERASAGDNAQSQSQVPASDPKSTTMSTNVSQNHPIEPELDDFGLPIRPKLQRQGTVSSDEFQSADEGEPEGDEGSGRKHEEQEKVASQETEPANAGGEAVNGEPAKAAQEVGVTESVEKDVRIDTQKSTDPTASSSKAVPSGKTDSDKQIESDKNHVQDTPEQTSPTESNKAKQEADSRPVTPTLTRKDRANSKGSAPGSPTSTRKYRAGSSAAEPHREIGGVSEWSHQALAPPKEAAEVEEELKWQEMPTDSQMDYYDDFGHMVAKGDKNWDDEGFDPVKGGAGRGYTRVQLDDDAQSATSMDDHTAYLFKGKGGGTNVVDDEEEEEGRNALSQMQATKDLLTEGQRIAYVGVVRLSMEEMRKELDRVQVTKKFKKDHQNATESMQMWSQKMMVRLYGHMDISSSEQVMIEQLAEHGIKPSDMTQALMQNARVKNPLADSEAESKPSKEANPPRLSKDGNEARRIEEEEGLAEPPPPYTAEEKAHVPEVVDPSTLQNNENLDIDLRWTVLCDLFLVLIADSVYDARSRVLLETVGEALEIPWLDICRFEKRVTDALEMQEEAAREDWDESDAIETRRKMALKRKYLMMGLATAGGGLLIGLTAGALAPVIGAGLAAGFSAIGVAGTSGFLAGAGGAAIITTSSAIAGGSIAIKASSRRMGAVRTFEYRPLHNNKRVNLILTVSGWMNGNNDDVRLPFSTVDPIMGDIYSLFYEPDMLQSMGDTIRIFATEALTQGLQQVLASTFLAALMAGLSAPIILSKLSYLIDNPWASSCDRADRAGLILADSIIDRHLGVRPITLVGFSLGARVIFSCLKELSSRGAYGLVQNVYIFGSPVLANKEEWLRARTVVSGRLVNGFASNDWILGYLFRATGAGIARVAGLAAVENVPGVENFPCTELVNGHMAYRAAMPRLLREVGWEVISDEFTEIEEADPENHESRQRELLQEIEDARQAAQQQPEKRRWWSNKKKHEKKAWETYDQTSKRASIGKSVEKDDRGSVLFDIDAIKRELESEHMEVKQLESTLPPMQLSLDKPSEPVEEKPTPVKSGGLNPFAALRGSSKTNVSNASDSSLASKSKGTSGATLKPESTPMSRKSTSSMYDYDEEEDADPALNGITMSFEQPASAGRDDDDDDDIGAWGSSRSATRPPLKSSHTTPAGFGAGTNGSGDGSVDLGHNAWADEEPNEEGEITMTFA